ncbi:hypothetical protein [Salipiger mucosus]|uniref:Uncharacterized protein n=1 Tax=Salipiger mucosus DSM 16094 TaxID=1123237 RepID=S9S5D0_9RHOB|nr:hypothetical protein [Salipiger mucosus]EPX85400.1 hypothetical protein Salmuc_02781 [Salipiger mucosus DSM 16094]
MSDPVTNVEIEDVLSSIRRLVSDDARPRSEDPAPKPAARPDRPDRPDRLVLTPAQRVPEPEVAPSEEPADDGQGRASKASDAEPLVLGGAEAVNETAEDASPKPDADPDGGSGAAALESSSLKRLVGDEVTRVLAEEVAERANEALSEDPEALDVSDAHDWFDFEPDSQTAAPQTPERADSASESSGEPKQVGQDSAEDQEITFTDPDRDALNRKIAVLEALIARKGDDVGDDIEEVEKGARAAFVHRAPEPLGGDASSDVAADGDEETEASGIAKAAVPLRRSRDIQHQDMPAIHEAKLPAAMDEDMLRDLVSETVRQELHGALGERITRNVRKLVRREIHRILMSQEFD